MKGLYDQSSPQMGPFPPNEVGRIAQHVRKREGRKYEKDGVGMHVYQEWKRKERLIDQLRIFICGGLKL